MKLLYIAECIRHFIIIKTVFGYKYKYVLYFIIRSIDNCVEKFVRNLRLSYFYFESICYSSFTDYESNCMIYLLNWYYNDYCKYRVYL